LLVCELDDTRQLTVHDMQAMHVELRQEERRETEEHINTLLQVGLVPSPSRRFNNFSALSIFSVSFAAGNN